MPSNAVALLMYSSLHNYWYPRWRRVKWVIRNSSFMEKLRKIHPLTEVNLSEKINSSSRNNKIDKPVITSPSSKTSAESGQTQAIIWLIAVKNWQLMLLWKPEKMTKSLFFILYFTPCQVFLYYIFCTYNICMVLCTNLSTFSISLSLSLYIYIYIYIYVNT